MSGQINFAAFRDQIFSINNDDEFNELALRLFRYQSQNTIVYKNFVELLNKDFSTINHYSEIPFLPVSSFKNHVITDQKNTPEFHFSSSGTTGMETSSHYMVDLSLYEESFLNCFKMFYGNPQKYCILALLPSYLERPGSSLVYMADVLIKKSMHRDSGFYLNNYGELNKKLISLARDNQNVFLLGVSFALLDLFENYPLEIPNAIIMETGGMKGRRREMVRDELHEILKSKTGSNKIHSEYGMTEMLSQAYSGGNGIFRTPPWLKILFRDIYDPFGAVNAGQTGIVHVIDLANIHSCAFIRTDDVGRSVENNGFEILGRLDNSEMRGCSLMIA